MIKNVKKGYIRKYKYGGSGIFDSLANIGAKLFTRDIANRVASSALDVGKSVAKEGAKKALEAGKTAAVDAASGLVKKALNRKSKKLTANGDKIEKIEKIENLINEIKKGSGIKKTT